MSQEKDLMIPVFHVSDVGAMKLGGILCASLNYPHGAIIQIDCGVKENTSKEVLRHAREEVRRAVDMILSDGLAPPADSRHVLETSGTNNDLSSIRLRIHNTHLQEFPFLLRNSLFDGNSYQIVSHSVADNECSNDIPQAESQHAIASSVDAVFDVRVLSTNEASFANSKKWVHHLNTFARPVFDGLLSDAKSFLGGASLHENLKLLSVCVVGIAKEVARSVEKEGTGLSLATSMDIYRWFFAVRNKKTHALITVGYLRTIYSSPEDPALLKDLIRKSVADASQYTVDIPSLKKIAGHRYHTVSLVAGGKTETGEAQNIFAFPIQCGYVEELTSGSNKRSLAEMENTQASDQAEKAYRLLEPQLAFHHAPSSKPSSLDAISRLWQSQKDRKPLVDTQMRKFVETLKSPLFTAFSTPGKRAARSLREILTKGARDDGVGREESIQQELKEVHGTERISHRTTSNTQRDAYQSMTQWTCKYATSFLNTHGGVIAFGVGDVGENLGVDASFEAAKKACAVGYKGIRPVAPQHMSMVEKHSIEAVGEESGSKFTMDFAVCPGPAPFYTAGAPLSAPAWGRFLASTVPLYSSVLLERLVMHSIQRKEQKK